jgi:hypothetical protein
MGIFKLTWFIIKLVIAIYLAWFILSGAVFLFTILMMG